MCISFYHNSYVISDVTTLPMSDQFTSGWSEKLNYLVVKKIFCMYRSLHIKF